MAPAEFDTTVDEPRGDVSREWELFVREATADPLRHVGSVSAPSVDVARQQATELFGWTAETLWLCPADETHRFAADGVTLGDRGAETATESTADESGGDTT
jgi:rSAM-partnered protein